MLEGGVEGERKGQEKKEKEEKEQERMAAFRELNL